ncbi:dTDP-4-dehydrorhamnose reductase [compost metagenome]
MKVLITGAYGQLGQSLMEILPAQGMEIIPTNRDVMDITDWEQCQEFFLLHRPDAVIHAAAYTAVDRAETEPDEAYRVNAVGTRNVAAASAFVDAKCCLVSTDYVFDGTASAPYREFDPPSPRTMYGRTKLAGEQLAMSLSSRWFIVRTAWLYGPGGQNFVETILKLAGERDSISVVNDQIGCPTYTADLSLFLAALIQTGHYGLYHAVNSGSCSWFEFATAIMEEAGLSTEIRPCTTEEFPRPAPRPGYSVLDAMAIRTNGFTPLPPWRQGLKDYLSRRRK